MTRHLIPTIETFSWQPPVISLLNTPPASPTKGDRYLIGIGTGAWLNKDNYIAFWEGSEWVFIAPVIGMVSYKNDTNNVIKYDGFNWNQYEFVSDDEKSSWSGKQDALGFTPENVANKRTEITDTEEDDTFASMRATKTYADSLVANLLDLRGIYDASSDAYPSDGGSGVGGTIMKGDFWYISVAGELGGVPVQVGDSVMALVDEPEQTPANWNILNSNIGYVPENVANKSTTLDTDKTSDTKYPSVKSVYDWAVGLFQTLANKVNSFQVTPDDTHYPSEKLVKDTFDTKAPIASPTFTGTVTMPTVQLGEASIILDQTLSADEKWSGITTKGTAGATLAVGDVCYLASSGKWLLNDGILDGTDTGFSKQLGICILAGNDTQATEMLLYGKIRSAAFPTFTVGSPVFLDDTAGDMTATKPSTANFVVRVLGYALSAEELMFNPSNDYSVVK